MFTRLLMLIVALLFPAGGDDDSTDDTTSTDDGDGTDDAGSSDDSTDDTSDDDTGAGGSDSNLDTDALQKELAKVRKEAADRRVKLRDTEKQMQTLEEQNKAILQALGIEPEDDADTAEEVESLKAENRRLRMRQDFNDLAQAAGANARLTWAYLVAEGQVDDLDPSDDDFAETLQERVKTAIKTEPSLASSPAPPSPDKGGGDLGGGDDNGVRQLTRDELKGMSPEEIEEAREKGQLRSLMSGKQ